ncbi:MAG: TssN family type VI secretion system protein [Bacteroidales bacterium]|nr:TssN family type VI secretion system protein [Bacteroidales bacterium]
MINQVSLLFSVFFALSVLFFGLYLAEVKEAVKKKKQLLLYFIVTGILIGLISTLGLIEFTKLPIWIFIAVQVWLLIVGILHAWLFEKIIALENKNAGNVLFTISLCFFGYGLAIFSYKLFFHSPFPGFYFLPAFFFIAPTFVIIAFNNFINIPGKVYQVWDFPAPGTLSDPNDNEMADPIIVNFEIRKQCTDHRTVFKAKAPKTMKLGRLFYFFVMDYNSRYPDNPILIEDIDKKPYQWSFCLAPNIFTGKKRLDPEICNSDNGINENASIICERIIL